MDSQITLFINFFIKNKSHDTIYIFKNYFTIVFSISILSFNKNKLYSEILFRIVLVSISHAYLLGNQIFQQYIVLF